MKALIKAFAECRELVCSVGKRNTECMCVAVLRISMVTDIVKFHSPPPLEGPLLILSSPVLKRIRQKYLSSRTKKTEEVSPVGK